MKSPSLVLAGAALLFSANASATSPVLDLSIVSILDFEYDQQPIDFYDQLGFGYADKDEFLEDYPIFNQFGGSTEIRGFGELFFEIFPTFIDPTFNLNEVYDWCVDFEYFYDVYLEDETYSEIDGVYFEDYGSTSFSASALQLLTFFAGLPTEGTVDLLLDSVDLPLILPTIPGADPSDFYFTSQLDLVGGLVDVATNSSIDGIGYASIFGYAGFQVTAKPQAAVPDSGTTGLLALAGFGAIILARRRLTA